MMNKFIPTIILLFSQFAIDVHATQVIKRPFVLEKPSIDTSSSSPFNFESSPTFEGSTLHTYDPYTESYLASELILSEWIVYETKSDFRFSGGATSKSLEIEKFTNDILILESPISDLVFSGFLVTKVRIEQNGVLELLDDMNNVLARVDASPSLPNQFEENDESAFVKIKSLDSILIVEWHFKNNSHDQIEWNNIIQASILDDGRITLTFKNRLFNDNFFKLEEGKIGCSMRLQNHSNNPEMASIVRSSSAWKTFFTHPNSDFFAIERFSVICSANNAETDISLSAYANPDGIFPDNFKPLTSPIVHKYQSLNNKITLSDVENLEPEKNYAIQLRYTSKLATDTSNTPILSSSPWSDPITFSASNFSPVKNIEPKENPENNPGSSGGGGAFFLLLTALPFLRRRSV